MAQSGASADWVAGSGAAWRPLWAGWQFGADRLLLALARHDLAVDLGHRIGSRGWWRGFATLGALAGTIAVLGLQMPPIIGAVPHAVSPAVLEERAADAIAPLADGAHTGRSTAPTAAVRRLSEIPERPRITLATRIGSGGLDGALRRSGVGRDDLEALRALLDGVVQMRGLRPGTPVALVMGRRETRSVPRPLESLAFRAAFDLRLEVVRGDDGALALKRIPIAVDDTPLRVSGTVGGNLRRSVRATGMPASVVEDFMRQMAHVVDLQRGVGRSDRFDIVIAHRRAETGETQPGQLLYAALSGGRQPVALMRWGPKGEFYRDDGQAARRGLMRTPVDRARMSSGFGMRFHPILGYSRMHQGIDFAAPTGTPVLASARGRVVKAGWGGGYGNVVHIDHGSGTVTRYAHLSRINVKVGDRVDQSQRVGAVGSTGLSTGPHLHYEVWVNGKAVNPKQAKFQPDNGLARADLPGFKAEMARLQRLAPAG